MNHLYVQIGHQGTLKLSIYFDEENFLVLGSYILRLNWDK